MDAHPLSHDSSPGPDWRSAAIYSIRSVLIAVLLELWQLEVVPLVQLAVGHNVQQFPYVVHLQQFLTS